MQSSWLTLGGGRFVAARAASQWTSNGVAVSRQKFSQLGCGLANDAATQRPEDDDDDDDADDDDDDAATQKTTTQKTQESGRRRGRRCGR